MTSPHLRWRIVALLFLSTVINYIDRQTLSVLGPHLEAEYKWTHSDFALIVIAFRVAYTVGQFVSGRLIDKIGAGRGLTISVAFYSIVAMATSLATGFRGFIGFRFLLGIGESANWPAATKAVSEWFPSRERALAVAIFDSGSSIGAAIAPALVLGIYNYAGGWRPAFLLTGALGFAWLILWRMTYREPERVADETPPDKIVARELLLFPQTWGVIASRALTDPVWFLIADWFAIYLVSRGFRIEDSALAFWVPFLAADLGNFAGGAASSWLIRRGWPVGRARKAIVIPGALGILLLIPATTAPSLFAITALFAGATFSYAAFSTIANTLPADCFTPGAVASVSGMSGAFAGAGTILATYVVGLVADTIGFRAALVGASFIPLLGAALVLALIRNNQHTGQGVVRSV
ncbi:MAG: MFS transporter [Acidobacteria bacterium]|nr:MFS transporter [Acidobacteriota bacterium]